MTHGEMCNMALLILSWTLTLVPVIMVGLVVAAIFLRCRRDRSPEYTGDQIQSDRDA